MKEKRINTVKMHTWFGIDAVVQTGKGAFHKAGLGSLLIPHPPVMNWILRRGMPEDAKNDLSVIHEFGHLQTTPMAFLYGLAVFFLTFSLGHTSWIELLIVFSSMHAVWEIMAEIFTITHTGSHYNKLYEGISPAPRIIFWMLTFVLAVTGWFIILW